MSQLIPTKNITYETAYNILCSVIGRDIVKDFDTFTKTAKKFKVPLDTVKQIKAGTFLKDVWANKKRTQLNFEGME